LENKKKGHFTMTVQNVLNVHYLQKIIFKTDKYQRSRDLFKLLIKMIQPCLPVLVWRTEHSPVFYSLGKWDATVENGTTPLHSGRVIVSHTNLGATSIF
jgi:hypothetical protein